MKGGRVIHRPIVLCHCILADVSLCKCDLDPLKYKVLVHDRPQQEIAGVGGVNVVVWRATRGDMTLEAVYTRTSKDMAPVSFTLKGSGECGAAEGRC